MSQIGHPKGLYVLFVTEMWERFSYYGMRAIFMLYLIKAMLYNVDYASDVYGSYTGLVYLTPLIGGYVADRFWGNRRSIFIGGILMALGQFTLFSSASNYLDKGIAEPLLILGLALLILGNGFFKPNISTMVGQLYPEGDKRVDSAFTIFYMGINLGAMFSPLVCGYLGDTGNPADFKWGFFAAGVGMVISVVFFELHKNKFVVTSEGHAVGLPPVKKKELEENTEKAATFSSVQIGVWSLVYIVVISAFKLVVDFDWIGSFIFSTTIVGPAMIITDPSLTKEEKGRIGVIYIVAFFVIFFWAAFEQAGASLTVFAENNTDRAIGVFIPSWIILILIISFFYFLVHIATWFYELSKNFKMIGTSLAVIVSLALFVSGSIPEIKMDEIPASFFQSINALAIVIFAPFFAWMWVKLASKNMEPNSPYKQSIGLLLLSLSYFVIAFGVKGVSPEMKISMMWLVSLYLIQTWGELCLSPIGLSMVNKLAPARFASLLMGVWFLSTAAANKFAGTLSALMPVDGPTSFIGYKIVNLYDFFMLFFVMSLVAAVILYLVNKPLVKMMHGKG